MKRFYTGKAIMQDAYKNMYLVFDFLDENKRPPLNFSSVIYLSPVKLESNVFWVSLDKQHQKELLHAIGEAIENAVI
jgi:hypothetical protein